MDETHQATSADSASNATRGTTATNTLADKQLNRIHGGDCVEGLNALPAGSVDLAFADPPFNIGYDYDVYQDSIGSRQYLEWSRMWIAAVHRVLKRDGTFWLAIGDEYAAELKVASSEIGFHMRSWVVWYYTFGVNCTHKFTRSHAHLFYFVKDPARFTFRADNPENRIPSARELVYNDRRANPKGRLPDDTWIIHPADAVGDLGPDDEANFAAAGLSLGSVQPPRDGERTFTLRPQDLDQCFQAEEDTWYFPRVAGTFKERAGFHGCQMPEQLLGRIIRTCSQEGEIVLDPFSGSATTLAVAKKLGRKHLGFELSPDYVKYGTQRLAQIRVGDPLDGSAEPTKSAPATKAGRKLGTPPKGKTKQPKAPAANTDDARAAAQAAAVAQMRVVTERGLIEAFTTTHEGYSADRVVADPELNAGFLARCAELGLAGDARSWNSLLFRLRKAGRLTHLNTQRRTTLDWEACDAYLFASEIALRLMLDDRQAASLDEILCDPLLAGEFDELAERFAPGYSSLEYRWAALKLRKEANHARLRGAQLRFPITRFNRDRRPLTEFDPQELPTAHGVYLLSGPGCKRLYAGETLNLRERLARQSSPAGLRELAACSKLDAAAISVHAIAVPGPSTSLLAWQSCLLSRSKGSRLNYAELWSAETPVAGKA